ncbi:hypothetical protein MZO42_07315 [Sphingomonas psychrotolerans]|uniref:Uncharacterized protein n=1 Tax=Sphingomonas psychrotolerans TaxID=1327635 RepID=A0ABU3N1U4_9SPHN|nr:hypothetical protein [Sphingomonas psychrotolerans]MDT8758502.1 hypothetical protein [Sphingomonas psychrotolerans]
MSHDQRPGRMRVVQDPGSSDRRRGNAVTVEADSNSFEVVGGAGNGAAAAAGAATEKAGLPLLPAALFLLACAAGGVLVAVVRPLGLG